MCNSSAWILISLGFCSKKVHRGGNNQQDVSFAHFLNSSLKLNQVVVTDFNDESLYNWHYIASSPSSISMAAVTSVRRE